MNQYGCHNREPFHAFYHVQNGHIQQDGRRIDKTQPQSSFAHGSGCEYTKSELGRTDKKCVGCRWRAK